MTPTFDFHKLGWKSFQDLCGVVLSEVLGQTYQIFSSGKDGGRDGAFRGQWKKQKNEILKGSFTVQCKHTEKSNKFINNSILKEDEEKAKELVQKGLADVYILLTNLRVSAVKEEEINVRFKKLGVKHFLLLGNEWLSKQINNEPKLKLFVPRVYGLGDLSQILDERAYGQANIIFSSLKEELAKFVPTEAYRKSAKALNEFGFVLLLGEPASGKTSISRSLALFSVDEWKCGVIKIEHPSEFKQLWNPKDPKQLFWVDDAFGVTQYHADYVELWNHYFVSIAGAITNGAKVIFTSRDYIYSRAEEDLKKSAFPVISESQVIIKVKELKIEEKEEILYNHIKLGDQPKTFKTQLKPFLPDMAKKPGFLPEIARRLGTKFFTKNIYPSKETLNQFFEEPHDFLLDLLKNLGKNEKAALGLIFINNGSLNSPLNKSEETVKFLELWDSNLGSVKKSLKYLKSSLTKIENTEIGKVWKFAHPTIRDAFSSLIRADEELLEIYLTGTPIIKLLGEITCGKNPGAGQWVEVPQNRHVSICLSIEKELINWNREKKNILYSFLTHRCSQPFLKLFFDKFPDIKQQLLNFGSYLTSVSEIRLINTLFNNQMINDEFKEKVIDIIKGLAVSTPDSGFIWLSNNKQHFFINDADVAEIMSHVKKFLTANLDSTLNNWEIPHDVEEDPNEHYGHLLEALNDYISYFNQSQEDESSVISIFEETCEDIEHEISQIVEQQEMREQYEESRAMDFRDEGSYSLETFDTDRNRFDDVDT